MIISSKLFTLRFCFCASSLIGLNNFDVKHSENLMRDKREKLEKCLDESRQMILEKYIDSVSEYISVIAEQAFYDGFCMDAKITSEALNGVE